ncbi:glycosyltransferase family 39 protein [Frondihabitans sp. PhB188]|uniref:glycosyltransferase family 39 protein n=1 Tax=Frondihabitans sp. PhB188 TaxID=2485200 RepID=UPI001315A435|nr:glycosyltransferase family 39 protein [Frondihabitans sp. PhB188]
MSSSPAIARLSPAPLRSGRVAHRRGDLRLGWALGLFAWALASAWSWVPSFWGDEAASVLSAERPLPSLFRMLGHVDAVHGTYYLGLHFWIEVFGASPFSVRMPAAIATGLAAVGLYFLVRELRSRRLAVTAALLFAVVPRTIAFSDETRAYAFSAAIAAWSLFLLVRLVGRGVTSKRWWLGYGLLFAAGVYTFLYFGLFVVVHALVLLQARVPRDILRRWALATAGAVIAAAPVIVFGLGQHDQVGFLARRETVTPHSILVTTWFGEWWFAVIAWVLIVTAVAFFVVDLVRDRRVDLGAAQVGRPRPISLTWLGMAWFVGPLLILMAGNLVVADFTPRYLSYSAPAAGLLMAIGLVRIAGLIGRTRPRRTLVATITGVALVLGVAAPIYAASRTPYAKNNTGWQSISEVVGTSARAGDAVVFDESTRPSRLVRLSMYLYPAGYRGLRDVTLETPYADTNSWHDSVYTVDEALRHDRFDGVTTVWLVEYGDDDYGLKSLQDAGYAIASTHTAHNATILELTK